MYQIVCVREDTNGPVPVACGFSDAEEARETAQDWINRCFRDAAYDHSKNCWWLRDHEGFVYRVMVDKPAASPASSETERTAVAEVQHEAEHSRAEKE
jgi:hypothetical protein